ncbi:MAG: hypothetical protein ACLGI6_03275 [Gammaproteobacteria bacterium]
MATPNTSPTPSPDSNKVQADNLLSQPSPADGQVAEEVSLDQQSGQARNIGQAPPEANEALAESVRKSPPR